MKAHRFSSRGFSLLELLVVIAIISILATLSIGGLTNVARSSKLTNTAQRIGDQIALARQTAAARNLPVEVRFYILPYFGLTTGGAYLPRGMQLYIRDGTNTVPVSRPVLFPERVVIRDQYMISAMNLLAWSNTTGNWGAYKKNGYGYRFFTIRPNGMLSSDNPISDWNNWLLVQTWEQDTPCNSASPMPTNYAIVQVNPITAKVTILRP